MLNQQKNSKLTSEDIKDLSIAQLQQLDNYR